MTMKTQTTKNHEKKKTRKMVIHKSTHLETSIIHAYCVYCRLRFVMEKLDLLAKLPCDMTLVQKATGRFSGYVERRF